MDNLATYISAGSAFVATVSVVLVFRQLRLVEKSTIGNTQAQLVAEDTNFWRLGLDEPGLVKDILCEKFGWELSDEDFRKYLFVALLIDHYEKMYFQYRAGLFPENLWNQWENSIAGTIRTKTARPVWDSMKSAFLPEFVERIDAKLDRSQSCAGDFDTEIAPK